MKTTVKRDTSSYKKPDYFFILEENMDMRKKHFRFENGSVVLFGLGASLNFFKLRLYSNYPIVGESYGRYKFNFYTFIDDFKEMPFDIGSEECHIYKSLHLNLPGSYCFYLIPEGQEKLSHEQLKSIFSKNEKKPDEVYCLGYFSVDPILKCKNGTEIPLDTLSVETVISKLLGPLKEWDSRLSVSSHSGYNAIHFTPFQKYGKSRSCYSISDHFKFDSSIHNGDIETILPPFLTQIRKKFNYLFVDIVLNHISSDSDIAFQHSECFYNLSNSPHLRPAFLIDRALYNLNVLMIDDSATMDKTYRLNSIIELKSIENYLKDNVIPNLRLFEFYIVSTDTVIDDFREFVSKKLYETINGDERNIYIIQDPLYRRLKSTINFKNAFNKYIKDCYQESEYLDKLDEACLSLRRQLVFLNSEKYQYVSAVCGEIVRNVCSSIYYQFLDPNGPRTPYANLENPLVTRYFSICNDKYKHESIEEDEKYMNSDKANTILAHQGWVLNYSSGDFAYPQSEVYIRRQLIAWGDCVKIRYTDSDKTDGFIWKYMEKYVTQMAKLFDGFRLDNCHSTPIHVLEHFIDLARRVNPNIILIAELFTNSEEEDNLFVNKLGLTCLIRERMSANTLTELCRIVHRFGGLPVGSYMDSNKIKLAKPMVARALISDMTHDNPCLFTKFSPFEYIPTAAFVSMAICPIGSVRGFDELVPYQIGVVKETRLYSEWSNVEKKVTTITELKELVSDLNNSGKSSSHTGIVSIRKHLNDFHRDMRINGFNQIYFDQISESIVTITRTKEDTWESYVLISNTAFSNFDNFAITQLKDGTSINESPTSTEWRYPEIIIPGYVENIVIESYVCDSNVIGKQASSPKYILGSYQYLVNYSCNIDISQSQMISIRVVDEEDSSRTKSHVSLHHFPTGSIIILKTKIPNSSSDALKNINDLATSMKDSIISLFGSYPNKNKLPKAIQSLDFSDINFLLFKCDMEEKESPAEQYDQYNVPNYGTFTYHGLYGIFCVLERIKENNDLGHPLNQNLREGYWLLDHIVKRIAHKDSLNELHRLVFTLFEELKKLPRYLLPTYFEYCLTTLINLLVNSSFSRLKKNLLLSKDKYCKRLVLSTFSIVGEITNILPPPLHPSVTHDVPSFINKNSTLSAGLPHFSTSWARMWGRDIFICLNGLLTLTGRVDEARMTILSIAGCLRHGLIPNLISSSGKNPRYNSRDATWFFLQAIQDYCKKTNDRSILSSKVYRLFEKDEIPTTPVEKLSETTLGEIIQEILQKHYDGIDFVELNAGIALDSVMHTKGFNVTCGINHDTGFVYGGNAYNCGTWMDKMGSSGKAQNYGIPASPRDGSAIELVALCASTLIWLDEMFKNKKYSYAGVKCSPESTSVVTWSELLRKIHANFESKFWIPSNKDKAIKKFPEASNLIFKTGIYKDTFGASNLYGDYQLRPNIVIAACVAPSLFAPKKIIKNLELVDQKLNGLYGMATLDPDDWNYCGYYNNSEGSSNFKTADGFNYHQGPEWLWIKGFYIRSLITFYKDMSATQKAHFNKIIRNSCSKLSELEEKNSYWLGLPELTQKGGEYCRDSTETQAWSISSNIEALEAFFKAEF